MYPVFNVTHAHDVGSHSCCQLAPQVHSWQSSVLKTLRSPCDHHTQLQLGIVLPGHLHLLQTRVLSCTIQLGTGSLIDASLADAYLVCVLSELCLFCSGAGYRASVPQPGLKVPSIVSASALGCAAQTLLAGKPVEVGAVLRANPFGTSSPDKASTTRFDRPVSWGCLLRGPFPFGRAIRRSPRAACAVGICH
jgi:hypothetical protein